MRQKGEINQVDKEIRRGSYLKAEADFIVAVRQCLEKAPPAKVGQPRVILQSTQYGSPNEYWLTTEGLTTAGLDGAVRISVEQKDLEVMEITREARLLHRRAKGTNNIQETKTRFVVQDNRVIAVDEGSVYQPEAGDSHGWLEWSSPSIIKKDQLEAVWGDDKKTPLVQQITQELQSLSVAKTAGLPVGASFR